MNISILIVCYNCDVHDSRTIKGVMNHSSEKSNVNVVVWNNGPTLWDLESITQTPYPGASVSFIQTPENKPLSWIYNDFISMFSSDYYVIFDHDSDITAEFMSDLQSLQDELLCLPVIYSRGVAVNPTCKGEFNPGPYLKNQKVVSIGSGLVMSQQLVKLLLKRWGTVFDERFALYGVDTTFFKRVNKLHSSNLIRTMSGFEHSLSRNECEAEVVKKMRCYERSIDLGLSLRLYPSLGIYWHFFKIILKKCRNTNIIDLKVVMDSYFSSQHPRTKQQRYRRNTL